MAMLGEDEEKMTAAVLEALKNGRKIQAIKQLRNDSALGLKEAKELIEAYVNEHAEVKEAFEANKPSGLSQEHTLQIIIIVIVLIVVYMVV